ncbi:hypothetical protein [Anaerotignum propionicum]|uniref:hypothetical protein n=1 Tax=Anaerotignum propionicum TaxID=28446 RepID=UPI00289DE406|nr:hypothetical protein [Anaerotignum propionicum]
MIPNDNAIMLYKFGQKRWMQKILEGELSFSSPGAFIQQAKTTGNYVQGDLTEGVFARLLSSDCRVEEMKKRFGNKLEIIPDGKYLFLRRKSVKFKPIFCFFSYTAGDALKDNDISKAGKQALNFEFDERMYAGFAEDFSSKLMIDKYRGTVLFLQPKPFIDRAKHSLKIKRIPYRLKKIQYIDMTSGEFFIEPTDNYDELYYKSNKYEYQHEVRICLTGKKFLDISERYPLKILPLSKDDYEMCFKEIYVEFEGDIIAVKDDWEEVN